MFHEVPPIDIATLTAKNFWPSFEDYFRALITRSASRPDEIALYRDIPALRTRLMPRFQAIAQQMVQPAVQFIRRGQELGCVRTDLDAEQLHAVGTAADNALDEIFMSRLKEMNHAQLLTHGELVLDSWRRLLVPGVPKTQRKASR
jgi:hypothetical protein